MNDIGELRAMRNLKQASLLPLIANPVYCVSAYFAFLMLHQIQVINDHLGGVQTVLVAWSFIVIGYQLFADKFWLRTPGQWPLAALVPISAITLWLHLDLNPITQVKSAMLLTLSIFLTYPLGGHLARSRNHFRDLAIIMLPSIVITFVLEIVALVTLIVRFSYLGPLNGHVVALGIQFFNYNSGAQALILFGYFVDSNHAALFALVSIAFSIWFLVYRKRFGLRPRLLRIAEISASVNLALLIPMFVLHNSRGARWTLYLLVVIFAPLVLYVLTRSKQHWSRRSVAAILTGLIAVLGVTVLVEQGTSAYLHIADKLAPRTSLTAEPTPVDDLPDDIAFSKGEAAKSARPIIWRESIEVWQTSPSVGVGPYNGPAVAQREHIGDPKTGYLVNGAAVHNSYLDVLVAYGLAGVFAYAVFFIWAFITFMRRLRFAPIDYEDTLFLIAIVTILSGTFFLTSIFLGFEYLFGVLLILIAYLVSKPAHIPSKHPQLIWR